MYAFLKKLKSQRSHITNVFQYFCLININHGVFVITPFALEGHVAQEIRTGAAFAQVRAFPPRCRDAFSFARACIGGGCFAVRRKVCRYVKREFEIRSDRAVTRERKEAKKIYG